MATSDARTAANIANAKLSTGPKTEEGKERSRRNSLKHGLTGAGVVLPEEDVIEVSRRFDVLEEELAPANMMALILVQRIAMLSIRLERCVKQEASQIGEAMRAAPGHFDDRRMAEVEKMIDWIASEPATNARRLRLTPEGVDRLIKAWLDLGEDLNLDSLSRWGYGQWQRLENLNGRRTEDFPVSRDGALCKMIWGDAEYLAPGEVDGLDDAARREWARYRLRERIASKVAELRALRETFDFEAIAVDRAESGIRAMFDPSPEATLARKYEASAERGMYRALKELREVQNEAAEQPAPVVTTAEEVICEPLGSFLPEPSRDSAPVVKRVVSGSRTAKNGRRSAKARQREAEASPALRQTDGQRPRP
jgi:hypothetical protein